MTYEAEYERLVARTYDDAYAIIRDSSGDAAFYQSMAEADEGPLLELGCGTGRILLKVAETGIACVGIDASEEMLNVLSEKKPPDNVTYGVVLSSWSPSIVPYLMKLMKCCGWDLLMM